MIWDVREWIGDGRFHEILLHRQGARLEMVLDGVSRISQVKPEHVDLDIDYNGNPLMVGAHCLGDDAFSHGAMRGLSRHLEDPDPEVGETLREVLGQ